ncbi:hypothetical protein ElyMa_001388100 [Elysia marginata]|uniref:ABC transmembrane type-1 domain-containing protein n=1 Tax=Elysia marginata TaxID=1093978 RepID=A0AAV4IVN5_9GAST|nr:hypothetical protein ElyMa_001388100 [Elysia marginata]
MPDTMRICCCVIPIFHDLLTYLLPASNSSELDARANSVMRPVSDFQLPLSCASDCRFLVVVVVVVVVVVAVVVEILLLLSIVIVIIVVIVVVAAAALVVVHNHLVAAS